MNRTGLIGLLLFPVFFGCGKTAVTDQHSHRFAGTLANLGRIVTVVRTTGQHHGGMTPQNGAVHSSSVAQLVSPNPSSTGGERDQDVDEMIDRVEKAISRGDCRMPNRFPMDLGRILGNAASEPTLLRDNPLEDAQFVVEGENCPFRLKLILDADMGDRAAVLSYKIDYKTNDKQMLDISRIESASLTGKFDVQFEFASGSISKPPLSFASRSSLTLAGTLQSLDEGVVKLDFRSTGNWGMNFKERQISSNMDFSLVMALKDFSAALKSEIHTNGASVQQRYSFADKDIDAAEFGKYVHRLKL